MKITQAHLDAWRRAAETATPRDWGLKSDEPGTVWVLGDDGAPYCRLADCRPGGADNALFIAYARQAFPALLDEVERLRKEADDARAAGFKEGVEAAANEAADVGGWDTEDEMHVARVIADNIRALGQG